MQTQYASLRNAACGQDSAQCGVASTMAIASARARHISRASGGNAVRSAAYNGRERIEAERTGEVF